MRRHDSHSKAAKDCRTPGRFALLFIIGIAFCGCSKQESSRDKREVIGPAAYGQISTPPATSIPRARPNTLRSNDWRKVSLCVLASELSPGTLFSTTNRYLSLFTGLTNYGLAAPSHIAFITRNGPRSYKNGERLIADEMEECWLLVWFAGARGWTNWDVPWAVFLQHKPYSMRLDEAGLHLAFHKGAEHVVAMPLYGSQKLPLQGQRIESGAKAPRSKTKKIETWKWAEALRREALLRVRYWAGAMREFPVYCEDSFSVDRSKDSVTIRQKFEFISIRDDWNTKPLKVAPVSPALGKIAKERPSVIQFSKPFVDLEMLTPYGSYIGVEETEQYDVTLSVLGYINQGSTNAVSEGGDLRRVASQMRWAGFQATTNLIVIARMAYRQGDIDAYNYTCYLFARGFASQDISQPTPIHRLIPPGPPSPFVAGLERDVAGPNPSLVQSIRSQNEWPRLDWPEVNFGHVQPGKDAAPKAARSLPLNWNTEVIIYE